MAAYDGKYGPQPCYDCNSQASQYLGRRAQGPSGRTHLFVCDDCASSRLGRPLKPTENTPKPKPTRNATFMQGHDEPKYTQASLFDE